MKKLELTREVQEALKIIVKGNPLLQPRFSDAVVESLLAHKLVRQTLGGTLKATDDGILVADPGAVAAAVAARRKSRR